MSRQTVDHEAVARSRRWVRDASPSADDLRQAASCFLNAGSLREAWEPLRKLLHLTPDDVSLLVLAGVVAAELGDPERAEMLFHRVLSLDASSTAARHNLAVLYLATDRQGLAEEQFAAILKQEPKNAEALSDLAVLYASTGRDREACQMFERCLAAAPHYAKGRQNTLAFACETGRVAQGQAWLTRLLADNPDDPDLLRWREKLAEAGPQFQAPGEGMSQVPARLGTVTVLIPAHNAERQIADTIVSVRDQSYPDIEILVIDDGSLDGTEQVARGFAPRVSYLRRVRQGWASAVNAGIQRAQGQWILIVDPGDVLQPQAIATCAERISTDAAVDVCALNAEVRAATEDSGGAESGDSPPSAWLFRRRAFALTGFFDEVPADESGRWSRRLMDVKVSRRCRVCRGDAGPLFAARSLSENLEATPPDQAYRARVVQRWLDETTSMTAASAVDHPSAVPLAPKRGLSLVIIGAVDPGGMFSSLARAVNEYTPHQCRVVVGKASEASDSRVVVEVPRGVAAGDGPTQQIRQLLQKADLVVFAAGSAPGAARHDRRLDDADEFSWPGLDGQELTRQKRCLAFLCSSPSVRGNYPWYRERFLGRGWPLLTSWPDVCLHIPEARFVPLLLDLSRPEYTRTGCVVGPVAIVHHDRPLFAEGGEELFGEVAARLKGKHGDRVLFGRCAEMTLRETLVFRQRAHIGFDRISPGAPRFGLTSLENSALGLVNIVYLDPFARALVARTLGTDELPWISADSADSMFDALDRLIADTGALRDRMSATAAWFRRWWSPERLVRQFRREVETS